MLHSAGAGLRSTSMRAGPPLPSWETPHYVAGASWTRSFLRYRTILYRCCETTSLATSGSSARRAERENRQPLKYPNGVQYDDVLHCHT